MYINKCRNLQQESKIEVINNKIKKYQYIPVVEKENKHKNKNEK